MFNIEGPLEELTTRQTNTALHPDTRLLLQQMYSLEAAEAVLRGRPDHATYSAWLAISYNRSLAELWEADEEKRARMSPRGPRLMIDGHFAPPEQIAEFPKGRRVRRRKAGPWEPIEKEADDAAEE